MTGTAATRALVERFFERLTLGDALGVAGCFDDGSAFRPPASMNSGEVRGAQAIAEFLTSGTLGTVLRPETMAIAVTDVVADGDIGVAVFSLDATTVDDRPYHNEYCWYFRCSATSIEYAAEFVDTLHAARELRLGEGVR